MKFLCLIYSILLIFVSNSLAAYECPVNFKRPAYKTRASYCVRGMFVPDAYDFDKKIPCEEMEVDHFIPLKIGSCAGLSDDKLKLLANDPKNIRLTHWRTNRSKGAKDLYTFLQTLDPKLAEAELANGLELMLKYEIPIDPKLGQMISTRLQTSETKLLRLTKLRNLAKENVGQILRRMEKRVMRSAARGISTATPQAGTLVLAPVTLAIIAWELYDACEQLKDLKELNSVGLFLDEESKVVQEDPVCGVSKEELFEKITGLDRSHEKCIDARVASRAINPPECKNFPLEFPEYDDVPPEAAPPVDFKSYD